MQIDCLSGSPAAVWKVAGQLDTVTAPEFRIALDRIDCARLTELTLDFEELSYISSAGLRELLILKKRMSGKPLRIENVRSEVAEVFEITGFSSLLDYTLTARSDDYTRMSFKDFLAHKVRFGTQQPILEAEGRSYTWADVERYSQIIAGDLQKLGVSRGTHVGICGQNSPNWIFTFYAVQKLGGIALLLNPGLTPAELIRFAKVGDITHLCYGELPAMGDEAAFKDRITGADSPIRTVLSIQRGRFDGRLGEYEQLCGRFALRVEADDPCAMIFTSGSTGTPKGVLFSAYNIQNSAHACISKMNLTPEDRVCQFLPMFHIFGLSVGLIGSGIMDARIIIPEDNRTGTLICVIEDRRCTVFHAVPTMLLAIMNHPEFDPVRLSTLRVTMLAGAPVSMAQMRRFRETFPNDHFLAAYGLSEMAPVSATDYDDTEEHIVSTIGKPIPGIEVKISDPTTDVTLGVGQIGEIRVHGENLMTCYYKAEMDRQAIDADGWLRTGDLGYQDGEGYLHFVSRLKELIIRGGENIVPNEVAAAISALGDVADVKVFGVPDDFWGEIVAAAIVMKEGRLDESALRSALKGKLAKFKIPAHFLKYDEFPLLPNGKVDMLGLKNDVIAYVNARKTDG